MFSPPGTPWSPAFSVFAGSSSGLPVWPWYDLAPGTRRWFKNPGEPTSSRGSGSPFRASRTVTQAFVGTPNHPKSNCWRIPAGFSRPFLPGNPVSFPVYASAPLVAEKGFLGVGGGRERPVNVQVRSEADNENSLASLRNSVIRSIQKSEDYTVMESVVLSLRVVLPDARDGMSTPRRIWAPTRDR